MNAWMLSNPGDLFLEMDLITIRILLSVKGPGGMSKIFVYLDLPKWMKFLEVHKARQ